MWATRQSLNRYSYVLNNPLKWVDPNGLNICFYGGPGDNLDNDHDPSDYEDISPEDCAANGGVSFGNSTTVNVTGSGQGSINVIFVPSSGYIPLLPGVSGDIVGIVGLLPSVSSPIEQANHRFDACIEEKTRPAILFNLFKAELGTLRKPDGVSTTEIIKANAEGRLDASKDCLRDNIIAPLSPNYKGVFGPGDPGISPFRLGPFTF